MATYRYPSNIDTLAAYLIFVRYEHDGYGGSADTLRNPEKFQMKNTIGSSFGLPVPNAISDATNVIWRDENDASVMGTLANQALTNASPKVKSEVQKASGKAFEKHAAMMFSGVSAKTFTYTWDLSPRNADEAGMIESIINEFTDASLPALEVGGELMKFPDMVKITVKGLRNLHYLPCVINTVNVEYAPDGLFQMYSDGHVPNMRLSVSFTEITSRNRGVQQWLRDGGGS